MAYLVSFLGGALGYAIFDKSTTQSNNIPNLLTLGVEVGLIYFLYNKFFK